MKHGALGDASMAWAVRGDSLRAVHVSQLQRKIENGLKCNCLCPECGSRLVAVKAGFNSGDYYHKGARRPHFRHHDVQQQPGCRSSTARKVALELLVTSDEIDLPAPRLGASVQGISGTQYEGDAFGTRSTEKVRHHHWVDRQQAILELESGRKIAVVLVAHTTVDDVKGIDGVLLIEGDDPELANMNVTEVLDQLRLEGKWLRWIRHWDDEALRQKAVQEALNSAQNAIDVWPTDLVMPEGLTQLQQRETVLHWALKEALAKVDTLFVPSKFESIPFKRSNGVLLHKEWGIPAAKLKLSNIRLEHRMKGIVPDVICSAFDPAGNLGHPSLLIEVAVTHKVDAQKRRKIIEAGLACLELDAGQLAVSGRIHRQDLAKIVSAGKALSWVYHEEIERLKSEAEANFSTYLAEQDRVDRIRNEAAELAIRNRDERDALKNFSLKQLYELLLECLEASWSGNPEGVIGLGGLPISTASVVSAIKQFRPYFEYMPGLMDADGVLPILLMRGVPPSGAEHQDFIVGQIRRFSLASESYSKFVTLLLLAVKAGIAAVDDRVYQRIARSLQDSEAKKRGAYARPTGYDEFVLQVVPRMAWVLSEQRRKMDARKEVRDAVESRKQEIILKQTQHKNRQIEAMRQREERRKLIAQFAQGGWAPRGGLPIDEEQAIQLVKGERVMYVDRIEIVRQAWRAREGGVSIFDFYNNLRLSHTVAFKEVQKLLSAAYIQIT